MVSGVKALMYSADFFPEDEAYLTSSKFDQWLERHVPSEKLESSLFFCPLGAAFSIGLFILFADLAGRMDPWPDG